MIELMIALAASIGLIVMAILAVMPTYHFAPLFLVPVIWAVFFLRRRLHLLPLHYALFASAMLLHMSGAFGFYQKWPLPFSFDILVHYWFAVVLGLILHHFLARTYPLKPWQAGVLTFFFVMGLGAVHEIMEYCSYLLLGEEKGMLKPQTSYFFDTQRDLTNNLLGVLTALAAVGVCRRVTRGRRSVIPLPERAATP